jgi:hypothetical protein
MTHQHQMSTPIFDELLREFAIRTEDQRGLPPEQATEPPAPGQPVARRHRAD